MNVLRCIQRPLPICRRPFAVLAQHLSAEQDDVINAIRRLQRQNIIRRFRAQINYRVLGRTASLIAAHVPAERFRKVADAVSRLPSVSHNYCRDHYYNLWFTLQAPSLIAVDMELAGLQEELQVLFHSLPAVRLFKLDVYFDPAGPFSSVPDSKTQPAREIVFPDVPQYSVELSDIEKCTLNLLQQDLPVAECPFDDLADSNRGMSGADVITGLIALIQKEVVSRISGVLNYSALGYVANTLFCASVSEDCISKAGAALASNRWVSHCYQRKPFEGWPFNLYAMCHAGSDQQISEFVQSFCAVYEISSYQLLPTLRELKKKPVKINII